MVDTNCPECGGDTQTRIQFYEGFGYQVTLFCRLCCATYLHPSKKFHRWQVKEKRNDERGMVGSSDPTKGSA